MSKRSRVLTSLLTGTGIFLGIFLAHAQAPAFANNLYFGMRGNADVSNLQEFLTTEGFYSGPITGNFFNLTFTAVKAFQTQQGITPVSGYFGPLTRSKANDILASELQVYQEQTSAVTSTAAPTTTTPTTTATTVINLLTLLEARIGNLFKHFFSLQKNSHSSDGTGGTTGTQSSVGGSTNVVTSNNIPVTLPATSTLVVAITVNGGSAAPSAFNVTVKDNTAGTTLFSGTGLAASNQFVITQGHSYSVSEATTSNSLNYTIGMSTSCSGATNALTVTCALTDTYAPPSVIFTPVSLPNGVVGTQYSQTITLTTNISKSFTWNVSGGTLPAGISLTSASRGSLTATISGTPVGNGTSTFSITVKNGATVATQNYTLFIANAGGVSEPTTPPISILTNGLQWGVYTGDSTSNLSTFEQLVGGEQPNLQAYFIAWTDDFPSAVAANVGPTGKTLVLFWESTGYTNSQIANGSLDSDITSLAYQIKSYGYPVILVPWAEMNGNWNTWNGTVGGNTPAGFIAMWQHVHNVFAATGASNVKWAWDVNNGSVPNTAANAISAYWPGSQYVDYVGVDGFNFGTSPSDTNNWQTFAQVFPSSLMTQLSSYGKPIYILSMGAVAGPDKAQWIASAFGVQSAAFIQNYPQVQGWLWFNADNSDGNFLVNSDPTSLTAFEAAIP